MLADLGLEPLPLTDDGGRIAALATPPAACPGCLARAGLPFPDGTTTRHCPRCLGRLRRIAQLRRLNQDHAHQVAAGHASWRAQSARWRASCGLCPLSAVDVQRYVSPSMIRTALGFPLSPALQDTIYRAWCAGRSESVDAWLSADPSPDPDGLWAAVEAPAFDYAGQEGGCA